MNELKLLKQLKKIGEKAVKEANQKINQSVDELTTTVSQTSQNLAEKITDTSNQLQETTSKNLDQTVQKISEVQTTASQSIIKTVDELTTTISQTSQNLAEKITDTSNQIQETTSKNLDKTVQKISEVQTTASQSIIKTVDELTTTISQTSQNLAEKITDTSNQIQETTSKNLDKTVQKILQFQTVISESVIETTEKLQNNTTETLLAIQNLGKNTEKGIHKVIKNPTSSLSKWGIFINLFKYLVFYFLVASLVKLLHSPQESSPIIASPSPENSSIQVNYFREAVNKATRASALAQSAKSKEEWNLVANEWESAIDMMKSIPSSDPNYEIAQKKVIEYQKNLNYAQQQTEE